MSKIVSLKTVAQLVDELGHFKAEIAKVAKKAKAIEDQLKAKGAGRYEGDLFDATVSEYQRSSLDQDAVRAKLSPQFLAAHTKTTDVVKIDVRAKLTAVKAA